MVKSVSLPNGRKWRTQTEAFAHFKAMLAKYENGSRVEDPNDHDDLQALVIRYDESIPHGEPTKIGPGIEYFFRERNGGEGWSSDCFHVCRVDGTTVDFSYKEAVKSAS